MNAAPPLFSPSSAPAPAGPQQLVLVTGMAGAGKSIALNGLEDAGFFCVDNLPPELIVPLLEQQQRNGTERIAIAVDARSVRSLPALGDVLAQLRQQNTQIELIFLSASDEVLLRRFSETRRRHPMAGQQLSLQQAIQAERLLLQSLEGLEQVHVIDTSQMRTAQLLTYVKSLVAQPGDGLRLVLQSFAFKRGLPLDANFVFDVRSLPNPYYEPALRPLTGMDAPVAEYLDAQADAQAMLAGISQFLLQWLPSMAHEHRSYVTVAIGCTGGQHRSVYMVEKLYARLQGIWPISKRHREQD